MKTYVITLSERYPQGHSKAGKPTDFVEKLAVGLKKHTIRRNYPLWEKRIKAIQAGEACLSIRVWEGRPYHSKQIELININVNNDTFNHVGLQKIIIKPGLFHGTIAPLVEGKRVDDVLLLSKNDGLSVNDFYEWFANTPDGQEFALIHFTKLRY